MKKPKQTKEKAAREALLTSIDKLVDASEALQLAIDTKRAKDAVVEAQDDAASDMHRKLAAYTRAVRAAATTKGKDGFLKKCNDVIFGPVA